MIYCRSVYLLIYVRSWCGSMKGPGLEFAPQNRVLSAGKGRLSPCPEKGRSSSKTSCKRHKLLSPSTPRSTALPFLYSLLTDGTCPSLGSSRGTNTHIFINTPV